MSGPVNMPYIPIPPPTEVTPSRDEQKSISDLPTEILVEMLSSLDIASISRCQDVCRAWSQVTEDKSVWERAFANQNLPLSSYYGLSTKFAEFRRWGKAIAACFESAKHDSSEGASNFRCLCDQACQQKVYEIARVCQQYAKQYDAGYGDQAMCRIIVSKTEDACCSNDLEPLILLAQDLPRDFALCALMSIAKRFADFGDFPHALSCAQQARKVRDSTISRNPEADVFPFTEMCEYSFKLKQYEQAEEYAKNGERDYWLPAWISGQNLDENFINNLYIAEIKSGVGSWLVAEERVGEVLFAKIDLPQLTIDGSALSGAEMWKQLSIKLFESHRYGPGLAACKKCAALDAACGLEGFKALCKSACSNEQYEVAKQCQRYVQECDADAGNKAMSRILKSQAEGSASKDLEHLIPLCIALTEKDREFGLQPLMAIAKRFAKLSDFPRALSCTQLARNLRDSKKCERERDQDKDVFPFSEMCLQMLTLEQYELAEQYASQSELEAEGLEWLLSRIIIKEIQDADILNEKILSQLKPGSMAWQEVAPVLLKYYYSHGQNDEAKKVERLNAAKT